MMHSVPLIIISSSLMMHFMVSWIITWPNWMMYSMIPESWSYLPELCKLWLLHHDLSWPNDAFYGSCIIILLSWLMHHIVLIMILPNWMIHSIVPASCTLASVIQRPVCGEYLILCSPKCFHNYIHTFINTIWSQFIPDSFLIHSWFIPN